MSKDEGKAFEWYRRAAEGGYALSQYNLGLMYLRGLVVRRDNEIGYAWVSLAEAQGQEDARELIRELGKNMTLREVERARKLSRRLRAASRP